MAVFFVFTICACTAGDNHSLVDSSNPALSSQSAESQQQSSKAPPVSSDSPAYAKVVKGHSLLEIGLTVNTDKIFIDPGLDAKGLWEAYHTDFSRGSGISEWYISNYHGNATIIHVDTTESGLDYNPSLMFVLQCFQEDELKDGTYTLMNERVVPAADVRERCILKKDGYLICDITDFQFPGKSFQTRMAEMQKDYPHYDFDWTLSVYDYVSENLLDLIVPRPD